MKVDIKSFALLCKLIKGSMEKHIKKKASIFTAEEMKKVLIEMYNKDDPQDLLEKITVSLMYYGLLRGGEVLHIGKKDVRLDLTEEIEVDFLTRPKDLRKVFHSNYLDDSRIVSQNILVNSRMNLKTLNFSRIGLSVRMVKVESRIFGKIS
jgi:hypothetical protein